MYIGLQLLRQVWPPAKSLLLKLGIFLIRMFNCGQKTL